MNAGTNAYAEFHQARMEAWLEFTHVQLAALERLSVLNLNVARSAFDDGSAYAKALLTTKDMPELTRLGAALAMPALDRSIVYTLGVCELGGQAQGELARLVDAQATGFGNSLATGLGALAGYAPARSGVALKTVKSALDTANSAVGNLTEFRVKSNELAQAKLSAASAGVAAAVVKPGNAHEKTRKTGTTGKTGKNSNGRRPAGKGSSRKA